MRKGITVIELMVVLAIIAIMGLLMAPSLGEWVKNYRIKQAGREMVSDLQFAKMKAISSGAYCTVVFNISVGGTTYDYIVFPDDDNDLELDLGTDEENNIYKRVVWVNEYRSVNFDTSKGGGDGITFTNNDNGEPSAAFDARGILRNNAGLFSSGSVFLINTDSNKGQEINVSSAGRIRVNEY